MARRVSWLTMVFVGIAMMAVWLTSMAWGPLLVGKEAYGRFEHAALPAGVVVITLFIMAAGFWPEIKRYLLGGAARERRILQTGRAARATVVSLGENSAGGVVTVNDQPYLNLVLEVRDGVRPPYTVSMDLVIPRVAVPQFQPGAVIAVKVDPNDPAAVVIDW